MWTLVACFAALLGVRVEAQTPPAAPPAGGTADGMPFDIPYGTPVSLETAKRLIAAVQAGAAKHRWKMNIAVVDGNGDLVHFSRMDAAPLGPVTGSPLHGPAAARFAPRIFYNA
jgi:hypothetical protein